EDRKFPHGSFGDVFQYICEGHIFPEIAIYRSSALRSAWIPREFIFTFSLRPSSRIRPSRAVIYEKPPRSSVSMPIAEFTSLTSVW
ncbi:hypothetical protein ACC706_37040, partial [Rhizobium johnstonii]